MTPSQESLLRRLIGLFTLIKQFEGCRLTPYLCPAGVWTCGWGSTGKDVFPGRSWTQEYADQRMAMDALKFAAGTLKLCPNLDKSDAALCAISDFSYNLGLGNLQASTLRKCILANDIKGAIEQLMRWVRGGGKVLNGLVTRRKAEGSMLLSVIGDFQ
jgi:lysozyme